MLLYVECHKTLHLTPKDRPLIVDLLQQQQPTIPVQGHANVQPEVFCPIISALRRKVRTAAIQSVKGHAIIPANERADVLAAKAAEMSSWSKLICLAHIQLRIL
jgi:hypothetical protein